MIKANLFNNPGQRNGWDIIGSKAMTSGVLVVTVNDGDYTSKISGISHTLRAVVGIVKCTVSLSSGNTLLTFEAFEVDGTTPLAAQVLDFSFFVSNDTNPTDSSMTTIDLDSQV
jgi:hypothetical protein